MRSIALRCSRSIASPRCVVRAALVSLSQGQPPGAVAVAAMSTSSRSSRQEAWRTGDNYRCARKVRARAPKRPTDGSLIKVKEWLNTYMLVRVYTVTKPAFDTCHSPCLQAPQGDFGLKRLVERNIFRGDPLNWNNWIRRIHRWLSIVFTVTVIANFIARSRGNGAPPPWVTYSPLFPLALLLFTGLYLFVLPYATKWRSGRRTD